MTLKEDAIKEHSRIQDDKAVRDKSDFIKFCDDAQKEFRNQFSGDYNISVGKGRDGFPGTLSIIVDEELVFQVYDSSQGIFFQLSQKCEKCGSVYETRVCQLYQIGEAIESGHNTYDCDKVLESKKENNNAKGPRERLLEALEEIMEEKLQY